MQVSQEIAGPAVVAFSIKLSPCGSMESDLAHVQKNAMA